MKKIAAEEVVQADETPLAALLSLVRSCEAVGINPREYLTDVLMRVRDWPAARMGELLPENWVGAV